MKAEPFSPKLCSKAEVLKQIQPPQNLRNTFGDDVAPGQLQSYITLRRKESRRTRNTVGVGELRRDTQFLSGPWYFSFPLALAALLQVTDCLGFLSPNCRQSTVKVSHQFLVTEIVCPVLGWKFSLFIHFLLVQHFSAAVVLTEFAKCFRTIQLEKSYINVKYSSMSKLNSKHFIDSMLHKVLQELIQIGLDVSLCCVDWKLAEGL